MVSIDIIAISKSVVDESHTVSYRISNLYDRPIFLVSDDWFTWNYNNKLIELCFARTRMQEGVHVFGYFLPAVMKMSPQQTIERTILLSWPLKLNDIWNSQEYAQPEKGNNRIKIKIGYGLTEKAESRSASDPEEDVLNWQLTAESREYEIMI